MPSTDELCVILRDLPAPSEVMMTSQQTIVRLDLIHSLAATDIPSERVCVCVVCVCVVSVCVWCVLCVMEGIVQNV